ncbi:MAG: hypothetical protein BJ554DRAFT_5565 [Olpidium bornovanus]|uniref:Uncharacterized protein n=1 Tax=Olpidium bornovanus TaxID=278681 RepID=A0A8H7ZZF4_9FUNG|nr:MAG: hypothetical protein BJ554DRAFT_5565 [Olpidium bornovanus]
METSTAPGTDALHPAATTADPEAAAGGAHRGAAGGAADDFDFDSYNDAALVRALKDLEKKNSFFELENRLFHSYLNRVAPHALKGEDEADEKAAAAAAPGGTGASAPGVRHAEKEGRAKKKRGDKSKEQEKPVFLTTDQKSEVATRELEELRDEIEKQKADWEKIMDNLKVDTCARVSYCGGGKG